MVLIQFDTDSESGSSQVEMVPNKGGKNGSGMFIPDFHPGTQIQGLKDPGSRFVFLTQKPFLSYQKYDLRCTSRIRAQIFLPINDPGSRGQKALDPGSGFATLKNGLLSDGWSLLFVLGSPFFEGQNTG